MHILFVHTFFFCTKEEFKESSVLPLLILISGMYLFSKMKLMILEAILNLEIILSMALIANRWHT